MGLRCRPHLSHLSIGDELEKVLQDCRRPKFDLLSEFSLVFRTRFDALPDAFGDVLGTDERSALTKENV
jgi:hypothetical protein